MKNDMTCDNFKSNNEQEIDTIKDMMPGFVFKCRGLLYPLVKYEDGTIHRVNNGELANLPEDLPVTKIMCNSYGTTSEVLLDNYSEAKKLQKELQQEIDEKCTVTSWLKPIYDELYSRLNQYANRCIQQMRSEGYNVELVNTPVGCYNYTNTKGELITKIVNCKIASISHIALSEIYGDSELVSMWESRITDKDNQILILYIPIAAGTLFDTDDAYITSFDVVTLN